MKKNVRIFIRVTKLVSSVSFPLFSNRPEDRILRAKRWSDTPRWCSKCSAFRKNKRPKRLYPTNKTFFFMLPIIFMSFLRSYSGQFLGEHFSERSFIRCAVGILMRRMTLWFLRRYSGNEGRLFSVLYFLRSKPFQLPTVKYPKSAFSIIRYLLFFISRGFQTASQPQAASFGQSVQQS